MKEIYTQICRLCLQMTPDLLPIYGEGTSDNISQTIMACTVIKISKDDGYPENICLSCTRRLNKSYEFKQLCEDSDAFLREYSSEHENDEEKNSNVFSEILNEYVESKCIDTKKNIFDTSNIIEQIPERAVDNIVCKEESISLDETAIPDQFEIIFSYPESEEKDSVYDECPSSPSKLDLKNDDDEPSATRKTKQKTRSKVINKYKLVHENEGPYKCKFCDKEFPSQIGRKKHEHSHESEKKTQCEICHKVFSHAGNMRRHALIHEGIKPYVCHLCGKNFSRSSTLRDHVDIYHECNTKEHECSLCDYTNVRRSALQMHMAVKHQTGSSNGSKPRFSKPKPRVCQICEKTLSSTAALNMHMKIHNNVREHLCRHCGRAFHHKAGLLNHERIHTGEKPFICPHCPKTFSQQIGLRIHIRTHTGERPYQCKLCMKTFSQQTHLRTHSFTHSGERRYACDVCNKRFALREGLRYHQMTHTGETPFKCSLCSRGFYIQYKLKVHMAKSHGMMMEMKKK